MLFSPLLLRLSSAFEIPQEPNQNIPRMTYCILVPCLRKWYSSCYSENILSSLHSFKFYKYQTPHTFSLAPIPMGIRHRATKNIVDMLCSAIGIQLN